MSIVNMNDVKLRKTIGDLSTYIDVLSANVKQTREQCAKLEAIMKAVRVNLRRARMNCVGKSSQITCLPVDEKTTESLINDQHPKPSLVT
jgi:hypothetical protein